MILKNFLYLLVSNVREEKWRSIFAVFVVAFAVFISCLSASVSAGFLQGIVKKAAEFFPPTQLTVKPKSMSVAMISFNTGTITDESIEAIKKMQGVASVNPQLNLKMPSKLHFDVAGNTGVTDAVFIGVSPEQMKQSVREGYIFNYDEQTTQPIPVIVPQLFLDMYNLGYADGVGFPKINEEFLIGKRFTLELGENYITGSRDGKKQVLICRIVGLSTDSSLIAGVYIPLEYAKVLNKWYTDKSESAYTNLQVMVQKPDDVETVSKSIRDMGFAVTGQQDKYENITLATKVFRWTVYGFSLALTAICVFCVVNMFLLILATRSGEIQLFHAIGARKGYLRSLYMAELGLLGAIGGVVGAATALFGLLKSENWIRNRLGENQFLPEKFFTLNFFTIGLPVIAAILLCLGVALIMMSLKKHRVD